MAKRTVHKVSPLRESTPALRELMSEYSLRDVSERTPGLLFDLDGFSTDGPTPIEQSSAAAPETIEQLSWLLHPNTDAEKLLKVHVKVARECAPQQHLQPETLSQALQRAGYTTKLHAPTANKLRGLRHQFLTVCLPDGGDSGSSTYVVDPNFRDSFVVAHPTPRYSSILESLTPEVVAKQGCLRRAVTILSRELARSFTEQGSPVPPWRTQSALMSKWQLQHVGGSCGTELPGGGWPYGAAAAGEGFESPAFGRVS